MGHDLAVPDGLTQPPLGAGTGHRAGAEVLGVDHGVAAGRLASYIAASASRSSERSSIWCGGPARATPIEPAMSRRPASSCIVARRAAASFAATVSASAGRSSRSQMTTNSSPAKRATTSPARTARRRRAAASTSTSSPASWPRVSLIALKPSRSMNSTPNVVPSRRARPMVSRSAASRPSRLTSPVRASLRARRVSASSSAWARSSRRRALARVVTTSMAISESRRPAPQMTRFAVVESAIRDGFSQTVTAQRTPSVSMTWRRCSEVWSSEPASLPAIRATWRDARALQELEARAEVVVGGRADRRQRVGDPRRRGEPAEQPAVRRDHAADGHRVDHLERLRVAGEVAGAGEELEEGAERRRDREDRQRLPGGRHHEAAGCQHHGHVGARGEAARVAVGAPDHGAGRPVRARQRLDERQAVERGVALGQVGALGEQLEPLLGDRPGHPDERRDVLDHPQVADQPAAHQADGAGDVGVEAGVAVDPCVTPDLEPDAAGEDEAEAGHRQPSPADEREGPSDPGPRTHRGIDRPGRAPA